MTLPLQAPMIVQQKMNSTEVKTRFAPSPTGYLHLGGARTALFNWLFAKRFNGSFVLRIEDTDEGRNTDEACEAIINGLNWLGLNWDEGPSQNFEKGDFYQSQRQEIYEKYLERLGNLDLIYDEGGATRFKVPKDEINFHDQICGPQSINLSTSGSKAWDKEKGIEIETNPDFIIRRPDGTFLFHFVNVVDDIEMQITHILRGEDHLTNTIKHVALFNAFNIKPPVFAHIPLILNNDGSKMSKRDAGSGIEWYKDHGFLPKSLINYIALLGWSPKDDREILETNEIIELFDFDHLNNSNSRFDLDKAKWINSQYISKLQDSDFLKAAKEYSEEAPDELTLLTKPRINCLSEIPDVLAPVMDESFPIDQRSMEKIQSKHETKDHLKSLIEKFEKIENWTSENIKETLQKHASEIDQKLGALMFPLRVCATGVGQGTDLMPTLESIGKNDTVKRINKRLNKIFPNNSSNE